MAADLPDEHDDELPAIAITGMACRFPGADSPSAFWELLRDGVEPRETVPDEELRRAGLLDRVRDDPSYVATRMRFADPSLFDADYFGMTPAEAAATDPQQRFLLETTVHALRDAALEPGAFEGSVGVYLGMNHSDYLLHHVTSHPEVVEALGWHRVLMGNDRGFTATGVSYRLGLTGPSAAVDCACSSSLAAVHHACRALLDYEADAAVAGGAGIKPTDLGYSYVEGGIGSPDGRCRPFSADARGTVFASGVGVVVLRRLEDALADGDRVLAVIRAGGVNNDGARKSGYTAPSARGQAELIASVLELAGIDADQVSYVEAHGTGTALGDPIEVSALTEAFRATSRATGFCGIGSVKSNIGHLDSASGIAGLIKVVLALRHRTLPPTLWCEETSPHIDFDTSPFRVTGKLRPWEGPRPLLAGVSSFGVGGTNVHLLVEEAPAEPEPTVAGPARDAQLLPFSAASRTALDAWEAGLRERLTAQTPEGVRDMAYTLARGHAVLPFRRALLWADGREPLTLDGDGGDGVDTGRGGFAFVLRHAEPGQKAVQELLGRHPAFQKTAERLVEPWAAARGMTAQQALSCLATRAPALLTSTVVSLGEAAVWAEHRGAVPRAVVADRASRPAAAVLAGALTEDELATAFADLPADGVSSDEHVLRRVSLRALTIPWYDEDGAELCPAGRRPDPALAFGNAAATPGRRTLPPRISALVHLGAAARLPAAAVPKRPRGSSGEPPRRLARHLAALSESPEYAQYEDDPPPCDAPHQTTREPTPTSPGPLSVFAGAVHVAGPPGTPGGDASLLARLGRAWALGLLEDRSGLVDVVGGRVVDLPAYPFDRQRHWLEPRPPQAGAEGSARSLGPEPPAMEADEAGTARQSARHIFAQCLGVDDVADDDDLFTLGGDSLLATRVVAMARARLGVNVPFGTFLREPTPAHLARLAHGTQGAAADTGIRREPGGQDPVSPSGPIPLTPLQERFLFLSEIDGAAEAYHVPVLADLRGPLDIEALRAALADVVARHESLRAVFRTTADGTTQEILPEVPVELPVLAVDGEEALRSSIAELLDRGLPLERAPAFAARVLTTGPGRHVLALSVHHICADAHSTGILLRDLYACYAERTGGDKAALPAIEGLLAAHNRAVAAWLTSADAERQVRFWLDELADPPEPLQLPGDRPPGARRGYRGSTVDFALPAELSGRVRALAEQCGVTPFAVVLAVFFLLLARVTGRTDLVVGTPVSGRHRPETRDLIGNFVNTLPLRVRTDETVDFHALLGQVAERVTTALNHQDLPVEVLTRRLGEGRQDLDGAPIFQVLFNMLNLDAGSAAPPAGLERRPLPFERHTSPYELSLDWWFGRDGSITGRFLYDTERFERETVAGWQDTFAFLLTTVVDFADRPLRDVPSQSPATAARTSAALTGPRVPVPPRPVHAVFADWAAREPGRLAVTDGRTSLTYGELARVSAGVADLLAGLGVRPGHTVGIAMARGVPLVCAVVGVMRAGGTPVPFDLSHPRRRLAAMAEDCGAAVVVSEREEDADFAVDATALELADITVVRGGADSVPGDAVDLSVGAYLTYTSGTTGRPKGIHFPHRALANLIHWETAGHTAGLRRLQLASFGFDASFHEAFAALCSGGSLHIADDETKHDHDLLAGFIRDHRVEKAILPVSLLHALAARFEHDTAAFSSLKEIASTGEQLRLSASVISFFESLKECRLINNYGPAETHVVTSYRFSGPPSAWPRHAPIGRPIQNVTLSVLDKEGRGTPRGSVGELLIHGDCVATGYLGQPKLTAERFLRPGPDGGPAHGAHAYRSGDRARLLRSGDIEFLGRGDNQVKIRGFRVELGEVETVIREDPGIRDVALVVGGTAGDQRIDAYVVAASGADVAERTRDRLRDELPAAMVPSSFTVLDSLPVNVNGKVEVSRLPRPGGPAPRSTVHDASEADGAPHGVLAVFRRVLDNPLLGPDEDFFDAGGHSLLATRVIHGIREESGVRLSVRELYRCGTAAEVAALIAGRRPATNAEEELPAVAAPLVVPAGQRALLDGSPSRDRQKTFVFDTGQLLDPARLGAAVDVVLARHAALRVPYAADADAGPPTRAVLDLPGIPAGRTPQEAAAWMYDQAQRTPIDPVREPLFRVVAAQVPKGHTLLALTVHLAALDGRSLNTLCRSLAEAYAAPTAHRATDDGFLRYLTWRQALAGSERAEGAARGWLRLLPGAPREADTLGPAVDGEIAGRRSWAPGQQLQQTLRHRCAEHRVTPFLLHLTAFATALAWSRDQDEVCLGLALDGRVHPSLDATVGSFANLVPFPFRLRAEQPLRHALEAVREVFDEVDGVRTVNYADLAAADERLGAFQSLPAVFTYAREEGEPLRLGTRELRAVGPDVLAPGQRLQLTVADSPRAFRAQLAYARGAAERRDAQVMALYRTVLYALVFEADTTAADLAASIDPGEGA
ncbi:non-ribosomal peptide synthetase [Streptomyces sp. ME19-01-6]|uniref:non-ribosomal peptide synthetase n=1 Tax=Streptomyces sp. ME19-01-6 TaxID=3028686 RepID=UPI0029B91D87|nr:non-ribosomal peptide synthetase [Streptomyces sp. ME19-01-6]MDX3226208.1 amino acid adenylation domain-containing protein [Streptomyces sp. ME19-01-6]